MGLNNEKARMDVRAFYSEPERRAPIMESLLVLVLVLVFLASGVEVTLRIRRR